MKKSKPLPSQEKLRHLFNYDPDTGVFTWKNPKRNSSHKPGDLAGHISRGYRLLRVDNTNYFAQRIAWMYVYGEDPGELMLDHINTNTDDNRLINLRLVTRQENGFNRPTTKGYYWLKCARKYKACIVVNGKQIYLGLYDTAEEARQAYLDAKETYHTIENRGTETLQTTS